MSARSFTDLSPLGFRELDHASMAAVTAGGGTVGRIVSLGADALKHAGACISNNWNKFKECFRRELNR